MAASLMRIDVERVTLNYSYRCRCITESEFHSLLLLMRLLLAQRSSNANAKRAAEEEGVDIRLHRVIYKVIEEVKRQ